MGEFPNRATQFSKENQPEIPGGTFKKGSKHISTWIQDLLNDEEFEARILDSKIGLKEYKGAPLKAIIEVAIIKAINGEQKWAEWLAKYGYGTKQEIDVTSNGETVSQPVDKDLLTQFLTNMQDVTKR